MEEDPIRRAASCGRVARSLARAIEKAAADREGDRAAELGRHLRDQMQRGVVANLNVNAVTSRPLSSVREDALRKIDADMADMANIIGPLQDQLRPTADAGTHDSLQHTLQAIHDGRAEINKALQKSETK